MEPKAEIEVVRQFMESLGEHSDEVAAKLTEMGVKGIVGISDSCPLANAIKKQFGLFMEIDYHVTSMANSDCSFPTPIGCDLFVVDFDAGKYPHLEEVDADEPILISFH